ncbi:MAG: hypothetical protein AAGA68_21955 [Pseudomonadota bacterium]
MRHSTGLAAALASVLLSSPTYAANPAPSPAADGGLGGVEWVRQTLESGFDGTEMSPLTLSGASGQSGSLGASVTLASLRSTDTQVPLASSATSPTRQDIGRVALTTRPIGASVTERASMEEVVAVGMRRREPRWDLQIVEEPERDWHRRDGTVRTDTGRIAVGRAVIFQDLSDRRRYDMHLDEYRDPRPQQSVSVGLLGGRRLQD